MNHCVPDFDMDEDYLIPTSSAFARPRRPIMPEDEIMELLWQNGQVVMQPQNQRSFKKSTPSRLHEPDQSAPREIRPSQHQPPPPPQPAADHLFMQEDEMVSWLQYPLNDAGFDHDFCADLLYPAPCVTSTTTTAAAPPVRQSHLNEQRPPPPLLTASASTSAVASASRPPIPPVRRKGPDTPRLQNFLHFARHKPRVEPSGPSNSKSVVRESTVVDSSETPAGPPESRASQTKPSGSEAASGLNSHNAGETMTATAAGGSIGQGTSSRENLTTTCEVTVTSSPGGSSASAEPATQAAAMVVEDRKRKARESEDAECPSEDVDFESADIKKQTRGSSAKRSRAAEVHNLSERRRRDRINEKMKALQELIPRCNKSDKASMLDEAIEYLKSLQLQIQMMSMGCGIVPMMFPTVQQYMPSMGIGIGMGMGMGMDIGMSRPMMPFPNVLAGTSLPTPTAAHLAPRFPVPAFAMQPPVPGPDPTRILPTSQSDAMLNSLGMQTANLPRGPHFPDPYQQYIGIQQMQLQTSRNQPMAQPGSSRPSASRTAENLDDHPSDANKL